MSKMWLGMERQDGIVLTGKDCWGFREWECHLLERGEGMSVSLLYENQERRNHKHTSSIHPIPSPNTIYVFKTKRTFPNLHALFTDPRRIFGRPIGQIIILKFARPIVVGNIPFHVWAMPPLFLLSIQSWAAWYSSGVWRCVNRWYIIVFWRILNLNRFHVKDIVFVVSVVCEICLWKFRASQ